MVWMITQMQRMEHVDLLHNHRMPLRLLSLHSHQIQLQLLLVGQVAGPGPRRTALLTQQQQFMERMQHAQNQWSEQQRKLSHARDEALMSQLIAETTRSTSVLITQLLTGLGALFQRPTPQPVFTNSQPQPMYHPYNNHFDNYGQPPAPPHRVPYSQTPQPECDDHNDGDQGFTRFFQL
ncbi:hypothetical protein R3I94_005020 [Phoxinus phoxinus]